MSKKEEEKKPESLQQTLSKLEFAEKSRSETTLWTCIYCQKKFNLFERAPVIVVFEENTFHLCRECRAFFRSDENMPLREAERLAVSSALLDGHQPSETEYYDKRAALTGRIEISNGTPQWSSIQDNTFRIGNNPMAKRILSAGRLSL